MKLKLNYLFIISVTLLLGCKVKQKDSTANILQKESISKYQFKEPYTYKKPIRNICDNIKAIEIEETQNVDNIYASNNEEIIITNFDKKHFQNLNQNLKNNVKTKDKKLILKSRKKDFKYRVVLDVLAYLGLIVGSILSLLLLFYGLILTIISAVIAPQFIFVGLIIFLVGSAIGVGTIALFSKYIRKKREIKLNEYENSIKKESPRVVTPKPEAPKIEIKTTEQKLKDAKELFDKELIDEKEYKQLKLKIINEDL